MKTIQKTGPAKMVFINLAYSGSLFISYCFCGKNQTSSFVFIRRLCNVEWGRRNSISISAARWPGLRYICPVNASLEGHNIYIFISGSNLPFGHTLRRTTWLGGRYSWLVSPLQHTISRQNKNGQYQHSLVCSNLLSILN